MVSGFLPPGNLAEADSRWWRMGDGVSDKGVSFLKIGKPSRKELRSGDIEYRPLSVLDPVSAVTQQGLTQASSASTSWVRPASVSGDHVA
jgi:hypothetical protein